jgi:alpha/beta superfamily hydrolase
MNWLKKEFPSTSHYVIGGFSFGSWIGMHTVMRRPEVEFFISVAPPCTTRSFSFLDPCPVSGLFVHPAADEIAKLEDFIKMTKETNFGTANVDCDIIQDATHFFDNVKNPSSSHLDELYEKMVAYINIKLATRIEKPIRKKRRRRKKKDEDFDD